ncbi:MAG: alpha-L-glutamate ligase-like protein [Gammaproteobacteria bacterium]|nr:MAG: alpha-L-glutamate ligase-like protein [Gammaproteobacteria bacterium]RLA49827.1 MAG: alpha-L-glutamate ligase-like protein [Gammaproteobacteria bacterium]
MLWLKRRNNLRAKGILGINERNIAYISRYNERKRFPLVDNKLLTKRAAQQAGIAVPELYGVIESTYQLRTLANLLEPLDQFVIKPTRGSGGKGILVLSRQDERNFVKPGGQILSLAEIRHYISNILSGVYSLGGQPDSAFIEALVISDPGLEQYSYEGLPDIRVVIFQGFPVMAMLRCPTHASDGKANLHQGAVGVGIDITTGNALHAVQNNRVISNHPDTGVDFSDLVISEWTTLLTLASSCYELTGLGYLGSDIVIDRSHGPLLLEINARPGLSIQTASGIGLRDRLMTIQQLPKSNWDIEARIAYIMANFGAIDIEPAAAGVRGC